jgi:Na+-transporting NADH:ubiquinone oxidoreductase subunit NqrB
MGRARPALLPDDPRWLQIAILGSLLAWGIWQLDMPVSATQIAATLGGALVAQWVGTRAVQLPRFDAKSAVITALGLCLLLRTGDPAIGALAGFVAIAAKFMVRVNGKHLFNPAMLGLVATVGLTDAAWISPGQWGTAVFFAFALASVGFLVTLRSERSDVTIAFLAAWSALLFGRAWWLGDPWAIPLHQLQNGALLLFAFFMISDPKTTPDARWARILYACAVAIVAGVIQFGLWRESGPVWALLLLSPLVPLLDLLIRAPRFAWPGRPSTALRATAPIGRTQ